MLALCLAACAGDARDGGDQQALAVGDTVVATDGTPRIRPYGLDSALLAQAFDSAARLPRLRSLIVARHGTVVREQYYNGATAGTHANIKSASKSIISALIGIAIAEGLLSGLDQPIAPLLPSHAAANADARINDVTVGHLLSMQAGLEPTSFGNYGAWVTSGNWVRYALTRRFVDDPGGRMLYSTGSSHVLSAGLARATGMSTLAYARAKLFAPLGIELRGWPTDPQGVYFGGNEMRLRPRELLTFAELYRNRGRHAGTQIVPESWIEESWRQRTTSPFNGHGYGLGWWLRERRGFDVYFAWGYGGQYAFTVPELELTVVMTSDAVSPREGGHNRALHDLLTNLLIPAAVR
jgi:CubicO group peptidase (beta-lactamase class C family)